MKVMDLFTAWDRPNEPSQSYVLYYVILNININIRACHHHPENQNQQTQTDSRFPKN